MPSLQDSISQLTRQFENLLGNGNTQPGLLGSLLGGLAGREDGGSSGSSVVSKVANEFAPSILGGPLGLIAGLLSGLFSSKAEEPVFDRYLKPEAISLEYDVARPVAVQLPSPVSVSGQVIGGAAGDSPVQSDATQRPIVIQVSAMDAQSFSNRSNDIAAAVREALTRSHGLRDEIWED